MQDFTRILELIKCSAIDAVSAQKPTEIRFGVVTNPTPLTIDMNNNLTLGGENLILLKGKTYTKDAKLALLRLQGGAQFLVLGEV